MKDHEEKSENLSKKTDLQGEDLLRQYAKLAEGREHEEDHQQDCHCCQEKNR